MRYLAPSTLAGIFLTSLGSLFAADFSWDGDPTVDNTQYGPSGLFWNSTNNHWLPGNTYQGSSNTSWINASSSVAQFKSDTVDGAYPAVDPFYIYLGEDITLNKIDMGGGFNRNLIISNASGQNFGLISGGSKLTLANNKDAFASPHKLTIDVVISGNSELEKINGGDVVLTQANTYTGATTVTTGMLTLQHANAASSGVINVNGATQLRVDGVTISNTLNLNGAGLGNTQQTAGSLRLMNSASATGNINVGVNGGSINATGTTGNVTGNIALNGDLSTYRGTINLSGVISGNGGLVVNPHGHDGVTNITGSGSNTFTGTTTVHAGTLNLNKSGGATALGGNLTVTGGTVNWQQGNQIADSASIIVTGGSLNTVNRAETVANVTIDSTSLSTLSAMTITGTLEIKRGTHDVINSNGTLTTQRAVLSGNSVSQLGANNGPSTWNIGAGGLELNGANIQYGNPGGSNGTINLNGDVTATGTNTLRQGSTAGGLRTLNLNGDRQFNINSGVTSVDTRIRLQNGTLHKNGDGVLNLTSASDYAGGTVINGGAILANNTAAEAVGSATGTGLVTIKSGGTLGGSGTVGGVTTVEAGGVLSPGADATAALFGVNRLNFQSDVNLQGGSTLHMNFLEASESNPNFSDGLSLVTLAGNPGNATNQDFLSIDGNLNLDPTTTLILDFTGMDVQHGDIFDLFDVAGSTNLNGFNPDNIQYLGVSPLIEFSTKYFQEYGTLVAIAPEPTRAMVLGLGFVTLLGYRRRSTRA